MRDKLFPQNAHPVKGRFVRRPVSSLEILEERIAPAVTASFFSASGSLQVSLGAGKDSATVTSSGSGVITVTGTGGFNASFTGVAALVVNFDQTGQTLTTVDSAAAFGNYLTGGFLLNGNGITSNGFTLIDSTGGNAFTLMNVVGKTSLTNNGVGADTLNVSKSAGFSLTNTVLTDSADTMSVTLKNVGTANLTDTGAAHTFTVSGWTGTGTLTGAVTDEVLASKAAGFTLSNTLLADSADQMSLGLSGIGVAYLTDSSIAGGHTFTVSGWTGTGVLTNSTGVIGDTVAATKSGGYTLTNSLVSSSDGMLLRFGVGGAINIANLTDIGGGQTFTVSGWSHGGKLTDAGLTGDTVVAVKNASYTLSNNSLSATGGMSLTLAAASPGNLAIPFPTADLTNTTGLNSFTVSGWTGGGTLTDASASQNTVIASKSASFTLTNSSLSSSDGMSLLLTGTPAVSFNNALLTDTGGDNSFTVTGWSNHGTLKGTLTDTVIASKAGGFALKNSLLTDTADGLSLTLVTIGVADLTDTAGGKSFTVSGWSGSGTLTNNGVNPDAVIAIKSASFTLANASLSSSDGMSLNLAGTGGFGSANLTDQSGGQSFTVSNWTGAGTLTNSAGTADTLIATKGASFTLSNALLSSSDGMTLMLAGSGGFGTANLTDQGGGQSFTLSAWTSGGTLTNNGGTADALFATKSASFTLANASLSSSDGMSFALTGSGGFGTANLTDQGGGQSFTVDGWTGSGTLTNNGGAGDAVRATKSASFTLTDGSLGSSDGMSLILAGAITTANLTDTGGSNSFTVSGWAHGGTLTGLSSDAVIASKSGGFILANTSLTSAGDGMSLGLSGLGIANLTDSAGGETFTVSDWTGSGALTNDGELADTVMAVKGASYTLANAALSSSDGMSLMLAGSGGFETANLTDTAGGQSFTVSGWTGRGALANAGATADALIATKSASYTLANVSLGASDGMSLTLTGAEGFGTANLTDQGGAQSFTVSGWTGGGSLTNNGGAADTVMAAKSASYTLMNDALSSSDGMSLSLAGGITVGDLTDTGGSNSFTVSGWTHDGTLTGLSSDTVVASKAGGFTLGNMALSASADGMSLGLSGIGIADLTDTAGDQIFTVSGWTGSGTLAGSGVTPDTVIVSKNVSYTLSNAALIASDGMSLSLAGTAGFGAADLTDTGGSNRFTVTEWTGSGMLSGLASDTVIASKAGGFTLTGLALTDSADAMSLGLRGIGVADLTDSLGGQTFSVTGWTGSGTLTNDGAPDTLVASKSGSFTLANQSLRSSDGMSLSLEGGGISVGLGGFDAADLIDAGGGQSFSVSGWTGGGMLVNNGAAPDTVIASKSASFTLMNAELSSSDGMTLTLSGSGGIGIANLTDTGGDHSFTVGGWTHKGALIGSAGDTVFAAKNVGSFLLTDHALATTDGMALSLSNVTTANLSVATPAFGSVIFNAAGYSGALTATGGAPTPKTAGLSPLGNIFYGGSGRNTLIGGTDQDHYILQGLATESDTLVEPAADSFFTFNGYNEIGNAIDFSHMTTPTETVGGVKMGVDVNLNDISLAGVTQVFDPAITNANPTKGQPGTLTLVGNPGSFDELAGSPFKDTLTGNNSASSQFAGQTATIKTLNNLVTLIYTGGDTTAEDSIVTGHGGAYLIYGKYGTLTEAVPGVVFRLPDTVPYFAKEPSGMPAPMIDAAHPVTYTDNFGNIIKITLSGPGSAKASYDSLTNDPDSLVLTGTTSKTALSVQIVGTLGEATVGSITDSSGIGSIDLGLGVSLGDGAGSLSVAGPVGSLTVGGINPGAGLTATSFGNITSTGELQAGATIETSGNFGGIGNITVRLTHVSGTVFAIDDLTVQAASIGNINASVSGAAEAAAAGAAIFDSTFTATHGNLGNITGSVTGIATSELVYSVGLASSATLVDNGEGIGGSAFSAAGSIGSITATASGVAGGIPDSFLSLGGIDHSSFAAVGNIGAIHVVDSAVTPKTLPGRAGFDGIAFSQIMAGGKIGAIQVSEAVTGAPKGFVPVTSGIDASLIQAGGSIESISIANDVTNTNIFAGANLGKTSVKAPTTNAGLSAISIGSITITGSLISDTPGEYAIAATGDIGAVTIGGDMTGYAIAAGLDAAADAANDNGRIAEVIVKGQYSNSSIVAGVQSDTNSSSTTPYTWGSLSDSQGVSLAGVTQISRLGAIVLGAATVPGSVTSSVTPNPTLAHDSAIEAMALVSISIGQLKADTAFASAGYIQESAGAEAASDTLVRAGSLS